MTKDNLTINDSNGDEAVFSRSFITGNAYVAVNGGMQVRIEPQQREEVAKFLAGEPESDWKIPADVGQQDRIGGVFYLVRQRKDNPLKLKIVFANTTHTKQFLDRSVAESHKERMVSCWGHKYNFFIVEEI